MSETQSLYAMRHSLAHIMATAIQAKYPDAKFGVGPVIDDGFYYDVDLGSATLSEQDLSELEKSMQAIIKKAYTFEKQIKSLDDAIEWAKQSKQPYKLELLNDLKEHGTTVYKDLDNLLPASETKEKIEEVSFYTDGPFTDLCRGPHVEDTSKVGAYHLTKVSGAYWRGNSSNPQMQRVYGVAFETQEELDAYLKKQEEARQRDHRKLGQELDLFAFSDLVGAGLPLYTPRGTVLIEEIKRALKDISLANDMLMVSIPHIAKLDLYKTSGHADKFHEELFIVKSHYNQDFVLKPVNCPHHIQIYASRPRSYKDLPLRYIEQTMQYRDEKPGQLGGLQRTRGFTVDDGHTFCRVDQIKQEAQLIVDIVKSFYTSLGLWGDHWVSLSVRDPKHPDNYIGFSEDWDEAESMLRQVSDENDLNAKTMEGEAAIYGPKLDFMFKDSLGRETQLATIQIDFAMPKRFDIAYTDSDGKDVSPVIIHRAILGSFERFIMLIIEHFGGKFPVWLAPEQVRIIALNQSQQITDYCQELRKKMKAAGIRAEIDAENETVGKKIRAAEGYKVPYVIVIGPKEVESGMTIPRIRQDLIDQPLNSPMDINAFIEAVETEAIGRQLKSSLVS